MVSYAPLFFWGTEQLKVGAMSKKSRLEIPKGECYCLLAQGIWGSYCRALNLEVRGTQ